MKKSNQMAVLGLFTALIVALQLISYSIHIGPFNLSFVLIPIAVGAILYGPKIGAALGAVFGIVVTVCCITGMDLGGAVLWAANPVLTAAICIFKGAAAGFGAGLIGSFKNKNTNLSCILAAICTPIINTGIFCAGMYLCFNNILVEWAGGTATLVYMITGLVGLNFVIELMVNAVFSPAIISIIKAVKKQ